MNSESIKPIQNVTYPRGFAHGTDWKWPLVPARQLVALNYGRALRSDTRRPGNVPVYGTNGQCGWHDASLVKAPGLILGRKGQGPLGVEWCATDFWVIDTAYYATTLTTDVDLKYLYHLIRYVGLNHLKDGTSNPTLSRDVFGAQLFPLPSLAEQNAITEALDALDHRIANLSETNATLEAIGKTLFKSWFVDFDPVRAKQEGRVPDGIDEATAALFPDSFEDSSLGPVPNGWRVEKLETWLSVLETGRRPKGGVAGILEGIPSIGAESIFRVGQYEYSKTKYVSEDFFCKMKSGVLQSHDVLLYKDGGKPGVFLPRVSMFGEGFPFEKCGINEHVFRIRLKDPFNQPFLYFWLWSDAVMHELKHRGGKAAIPGINQSDVKDQKISVPGEAVLRRFDELVSPLISRILNNSTKAQTLITLRDNLLPRLISGRLRLLDAAVLMKQTA